MVKKDSEGSCSEFSRISVVQQKETWRAKSLTLGDLLIVLFPALSPSAHTETSRYRWKANSCLWMSQNTFCCAKLNEKP